MDKQYQLYKVDENGIAQYLYTKPNGLHALCKTKASCYDYHNALKLQRKYSRHNLIMCDHESEYFKLSETRYDEWTRKIAEDDCLRYQKTETIQAAVELCYRDEVLAKIISATSEAQIYRTLKSARECA